MAKDRAKDPKRVPNLGISDPISHVRTVSSAETSMKLHSADNATQRDYNDMRTYEAGEIKSGRAARSAARAAETRVKVRRSPNQKVVRVDSNPVKDN